MGKTAAINPELCAIHLHGRLGKEFGRVHHMAVKTAAEAVRALCFQLPEFRDSIARGAWKVIRGPVKTGLPLNTDSLGLGLGKSPLHIIPAPVGSGGRGTTKIIIGIALVATAFILPVALPEAAAIFGTAGTIGGIPVFGQIALLGAAMTLSGISALIAPTVQNNIGKDIAQNPSYILSGAVNTATEGVCVPVVYGEVMCGSVVGAVTITAVDYGTNNPDGGVKVGADGTTKRIASLFGQ